MDQRTSIKETVERITSLLGFDNVRCAVGQTLDTQKDIVTTTCTLTVSSEESAQLIGHHGGTLYALESIVRAALHHQKIAGRIVVDINDYKKMRTEQLSTQAHAVAATVARSKKPHIFEPMPASDRRVIHEALATHEHVKTESVGERQGRKVVVAPQGIV